MLSETVKAHLEKWWAERKAKKAEQREREKQRNREWRKEYDKWYNSLPCVKAKIREQKKRYREKHIEQFRQKGKEYYYAHKEEQNAKSRERYYKKKKEAFFASLTEQSIDAKHDISPNKENAMYCFQIPIKFRAADLPASDYATDAKSTMEEKKARCREKYWAHREQHLKANAVCYWREKAARERAKDVAALIDETFMEDVERDVARSRQREAGELPADFFNPFP